MNELIKKSKCALSFAFKVGYEYRIGVWRHNRNVSKHNAKIYVSLTF